MCKKLLARCIVSCSCMALIALPAIGQGAEANVATVESEISTHNQQLNSLKSELELTQFKRKEAEDQLSELKRELESKRDQITELRNSYGPNPTEAQEEFVNNESKRIALAELGIKSRAAAISRLERKEYELQSDLQSLSNKLNQSQAKLERAKATDQKEKEAKARALAAQLAALKRENERLKKEKEQEARLAQMAIDEAARLAQEARDRQEQERLAAAEEAQRKAAAAISAQNTNEEGSKLADQEGNVDMGRMVLEGEEPIYEGDDGFEVIMRSRDIADKKVYFKQVGHNRFVAIARVEPGRAYFDLRKRRYRGKFDGEGDGKLWQFTYVISDERGERPKLSVKEVIDPQIVSQGEESF